MNGFRRFIGASVIVFAFESTTQQPKNVFNPDTDRYSVNNLKLSSIKNYRVCVMRSWSANIKECSMRESLKKYGLLACPLINRWLVEAWLTWRLVPGRGGRWLWYHQGWPVCRRGYWRAACRRHLTGRPPTTMRVAPPTSPPSVANPTPCPASSFPLKMEKYISLWL